MQPYTQSTPYTSAAACFLTLLHNKNQEITLTKETEFDIWQQCVILPTRACSIFALATYAKSKNVQTQIYVESLEYDFPDYRFYRYTKEDIQEASFSEAQHIKGAKKAGIVIKEQQITIQDIMQILNEGKQLLLRVNAKEIREEKRNTSNYIAIISFDKTHFTIIDAILGQTTISKELLEHSLATLVVKKHRDNRMLVFE